MPIDFVIFMVLLFLTGLMVLQFLATTAAQEVYMSFRLFFGSFVRHTCLLFDLRIVGKEDMVPRGQALIGLSEVLQGYL